MVPSEGATKPTIYTRASNLAQRNELLLLVGVLMSALFLRLVVLDRVPPGVRFDELVNVKMADHIYAGEWPIYFQEAWGHEPLYHYFQAAGMSLLGKTVLGVRIASISFGVLGVLTTYLVVRLLLGPRVALLTALLLGTSFWSLLYSRLGLRHISLTPWIGWTAYCFWRGIQSPPDKSTQGALWFSLGGLSMGVMLYTYFASRAVPAIFGAFVGYLLLFHRSILRGRWMGLLLFFLLPALIVAPMVLYLRQHPELEQRLGQVADELLRSLRAGDLRPLLRAVLDTLKMFGVKGDPEWLYNISGRPVFDPLAALLFGAGVLMCLWQWRTPSRAFVLLWLAVGITPAMFSWPPGSLGHAIAAQPVTYVFPSLSLVAIWDWSVDGISPEFRKPRWMRWGARGLVVASVLLSVFSGTYDYFARWPGFREVRHEYQAPITEVARHRGDYAGTEPAFVSAPYVDYWNPWSKMNFDLYLDERKVRWFDGTQSILFPGEGDALFYLPDHILRPSDLNASFGALLRNGAEPIESSDENHAFDLYRWHNRGPLEQRLISVSSAEVWASPEGPYVQNESERQRETLVLPLDFGHRLAFLGYSYDRPAASAGEPWEVTTYWQILDADSDPLAIFLHLLDDANTVQAGWDGLYVSTESWQEDDILVHVHTLQVPEGLHAGDQRVELGVYSPVTLERLPLFLGDGNETAPHSRVLLTSLRVQ